MRLIDKQKALDNIIERYKSQKDRDLLELVDCCYGIDCDDCPFKSSTDCGDAIAIELLDRLIKVEESVGTERYNFCPHCGADMRGVDNEVD